MRQPQAIQGGVPTTVDSYIAAQPTDHRPTLERIRQIVRAAAPMAEERISYGMPTFWLGTNIFHFAIHAHHIGIYPGSGAIQAHAALLSRYATSKGAIQLPRDRPLPRRLLTSLVKFNLRRTAAKKAASTAPKIHSGTDQPRRAARRLTKRRPSTRG